MGNPANPAPLEDVALAYVLEAMEQLGAYSPSVNPTAAMFAQTYMRGFVRGILHFFDDHYYTTWDNYPNDPTSSVTQLDPNGPRLVLNREFIKESSAWTNDGP